MVGFQSMMDYIVKICKFLLKFKIQNKKFSRLSKYYNQRIIKHLCQGIDKPQVISTKTSSVRFNFFLIYLLYMLFKSFQKTNKIYLS